MKNLVILKHGGGELANQLWNYVSIYSYGLEIKSRVQNPSFFEYHSFFNLLEDEDLSTRLFSFFFKRIRRRSHPVNASVRMIYLLTARFKEALHRPCIFSSENFDNKVTYLPPTSLVPSRYGECGSIYFKGWLFRNPLGMEKHRKEIITAFSPKKEVQETVSNIILKLRREYSTIIGIHLRQGDYRTFKDGRYLISQERMREIVSEYAHLKSLDAAKTAFVLTSDGKIDPTLYANLNIYISEKDAVTDLFLLSACDVVIGSDSSYGSFASWYGNIPHIIAKKEAIDWGYYSDKSAFFKNKYSTMTHY